MSGQGNVKDECEEMEWKEMEWEGCRIRERGV